MDKKKKILKKNKVKAPNTKTVGEPKSEIFGLFLMVIGIIFFISIFSDKMGIIGRLVYKFLSVLLGSANYIFPLLLIFWGILYNITATKLYTKRYIICSLIIYFSILILLDASKELDLTLVDRINRSIEYMSIARSGGIIGAILGFFSYKLLGSLGTYIFVGIIILVNLYIMLRTNIDQIIMAYEDLSDYLEDRKKILAEKKIKKENDKSNKVEEKELKKSQKEDKKLKILDNFKIKKDNLLEDNKTKENKDFIIKEYKTTNINNTQENNSNIQESSSEELTEKDKEEFKNIDQELPDETYIYPDISLLNINESNNTMSNQEIIKNGKIIEKTLDNFNMDCQITSINKGPVITCYELKPAPGIKLSRIVSLSDNISMALGSSDIRIEAPIPGKTVVGIEVANKFKDSVGLREILESSEFVNSKSVVPLTLGKDVEGNIIVESISDMPHLLIAGATGSGKSVCINTIITNILYKSSPNDVRLMLIDPKVVELSVYNGIPHLLIPVVTNPKKAGYALNWAVDEMERRYKLFAEAQVRDIKGYNKKKIKEGKISEKIPKIVIIVDELADLMMVSSNEIEDYIARLAQMARACGMHLILATQRPSVDVITGTIKANIPSRIAFAVSSAVDSRTILDMSGAEKLLGRGDMLFYPSSYSKPKRIQGAFISDEEVERLVDFVKLNNENSEINKQSLIASQINNKEKDDNLDLDPLFADAINYVLGDEQASISYLQRKLKVGYSRAARIVDQMEELGIIGPHEGSKPRKLLKTKEEIDNLLGDDDE
ncbi:DNA translocase FtsK [Peptoniphilus lacrimalis]|uniref:DNA translocase FtsK n=1 Tax=Peptoniphilus lacrimalis TaxID=33031 RepID=UPI00254E3D5D|nr:DNA translocase FtsK [Peptoniphilus lacrimalis]MDK7722022.1 DNA translocase FtsK [Peptoniphilus lacrimalis]MDK7731732.1 DNA translocase FtsK [Peptoniphilus lacrimalis]